ncbi:hypothetical protein [Spiroplasma endosymbiont of Panorpa germanica]|uniref:hypothetical protein n=1 Tax=Spiroplasma endosymbiont of Panorpa germanica TaxID=3066314 RepID=UPI0030D1A48C
MSFKWITLTVLIVLYVFALVITGVLALRYQKKHKKFKTVNEQMIILLKDAEKEFLTSKNSYSCKYPLPKNEDLLFQTENVCGFKKSVKKREDEDFYIKAEFFLEKQTMKENYSLKNNKYKNFDFQGELILSNFRMLLQNEDGFLQLPIQDIKEVKPMVFNVNSNYQIGIFLLTEKTDYKIVTENMQLYYFLKKISKED